MWICFEEVLKILSYLRENCAVILTSLVTDLSCTHLWVDVNSIEYEMAPFNLGEMIGDGFPHTPCPLNLLKVCGVLSKSH